MLRAEGIRVDFDGAPALAGVDLAVDEAETVAVLGPSGCGKTTLLRVLAGLQRPDGGRVLLAGRDLGGTPPHRRGIGLLFQDGALFPHRDVAGNVGFGLRMAGLPAPELERRTAALLELVGLAGMGARSVETLSGGERQRVALARSLAREPRVLLLDEPLGALDRPLREELSGELAALFARLGLTVVYVTHDVGEAFALGRRVAVMRAGRVVQVASPDALWSRPADAWTARFLGLANVVERDGRALVTRPEAVHVAAARDGEATVVSAERRGSTVRLRVRLPDGNELEAAVTTLDHPATGDRVRVTVDPDGVVEVPLRSPA